MFTRPKARMTSLCLTVEYAKDFLILGLLLTLRMVQVQDLFVSRVMASRWQLFVCSLAFWTCRALPALNPSIQLSNHILSIQVASDGQLHILGPSTAPEHQITSQAAASLFLTSRITSDSIIKPLPGGSRLLLSTTSKNLTISSVAPTDYRGSVKSVGFGVHLPSSSQILTGAISDAGLSASQQSTSSRSLSVASRSSMSSPATTQSARSSRAFLTGSPSASGSAFATHPLAILATTTETVLPSSAFLQTSTIATIATATNIPGKN